MSTNTKIEWTEATWSPVTGCDRVSPGCDHCYAMTLAKRLKAMGSAKYQTDGDPRTSGPGFGVATHESALDLPLRWQKPRKIFVNSMSDLFHKDIPAEYIARVFAVMVAAPEHTYQVLTKRHGRMASLLGSKDFWTLVSAELGRMWRTEPPAPLRMIPPWIWIGVSVESQQWADIRVPALLSTPAAVRWLSCEPLLGPVDLSSWLRCNHVAATGTGASDHWRCDYCATEFRVVTDGNLARTSHMRFGLSWVVAGGESGAGHRPLNLDWARSLRDQCTAAGVPFLFKQVGGRTPKAGGRELDGRTWDQYPERAA